MSFIYPNLHCVGYLCLNRIQISNANAISFSDFPFFRLPKSRSFIVVKLPKSVYRWLRTVLAELFLSGMPISATEKSCVWRFDAMGANAAIEKIGKHLKMFTDKHEHSGPDGKPIETVNKSDLTDEQLTEKIKLLSTKVEGGNEV